MNFMDEGLDDNENVISGENNDGSSGDELESFGEEPILSDDDIFYHVNENAKGKGNEKMVEYNENVRDDNDILRCPRDPDDDDDQNVFDFPEFDGLET